MSVINNQRDMDNFLSDLRDSDKSGEFTDKDREQIAAALPTEVLMNALLERADTAFPPALSKRAKSIDQKSDVCVRVLNAWSLMPDQRLGQLVVNSFEKTKHPYSTADEFAAALFNCEDGELVRQIEAFVAGYAQPPR